MIVVIGGIKGGTGKTTIATNLTVMRASTGKKVLLVDGDEQRSASMWAEQREILGWKTDWSTIQLSGKAIRSQLERMKQDYDDIIVDVGGRETTSLRAALSIADVCLIPFKPRSLDVWTLGDIKILLSEMRPANPTMEAFAVINQGDSKGSDNLDTLEILKGCEGLGWCPCTIGNRKAFANAASDGLGIKELKPVDIKALEEIELVTRFIYEKHIQNTFDTHLKNT